MTNKPDALHPACFLCRLPAFSQDHPDISILADQDMVEQLAQVPIGDGLHGKK